MLGAVWSPECFLLLDVVAAAFRFHGNPCKSCGFDSRHHRRRNVRRRFVLFFRSAKKNSWQEKIERRWQEVSAFISVFSFLYQSFFFWLFFFYLLGSFSFKERNHSKRSTSSSEYLFFRSACSLSTNSFFS